MDECDIFLMVRDYHRPSKPETLVKLSRLLDWLLRVKVKGGDKRWRHFTFKSNDSIKVFLKSRQESLSFVSEILLKINLDIDNVQLLQWRRIYCCLKIKYAGKIVRTPTKYEDTLNSSAIYSRHTAGLLNLKHEVPLEVLSTITV